MELLSNTTDASMMWWDTVRQDFLNVTIRNNLDQDGGNKNVATIEPAVEKPVEAQKKQSKPRQKKSGTQQKKPVVVDNTRVVDSDTIIIPKEVATQRAVVSRKLQCRDMHLVTCPYMCSFKHCPFHASKNGCPFGGH